MSIFEQAHRNHSARRMISAFTLECDGSGVALVVESPANAYRETPYRHQRLLSFFSRRVARRTTKATPEPSHSKGFAAVLNFILLCFFAVVVAAQTETGQIIGKVTDPA